MPGVCPAVTAPTSRVRGWARRGWRRRSARLVPVGAARAHGRIERLGAGRGRPPARRVRPARPGDPAGHPDGGEGARPARRHRRRRGRRRRAPPVRGVPLRGAGLRADRPARRAGGAARARPSRVIVQAYEPAARAVQLGARHAVEEFLEGEVARRRAHDLPPFAHLVRIVLDGDAPEAVVRAAVDLADALRVAAPEVGVLGPSPLHRLRGRTRRAILLSAREHLGHHAPAARRCSTRAPRRCGGRACGRPSTWTPRRAEAAEIGDGGWSFATLAGGPIPVKEHLHMPVPRLFEASNEPREQWVHVLATLLTLGGPETRTALVEEISGEALPGADALLVFEQRPMRGGPEGLLADIIARGAGWTIAIQSTLAFDADEEERLVATHDALSEVYDKVILVAVTPDRKPSPAVERRRRGNPRHPPPQLAARARLGPGAARARAGPGHGPPAAAGGRVLLHAARRRALPARGAHAHGRAVPAPAASPASSSTSTSWPRPR